MIRTERTNRSNRLTRSPRSPRGRRAGRGLWRSPLAHAALAALLTAALALPAAAQTGSRGQRSQAPQRPPSPSFENDPGYVDFEALGLVAGEGEESLRISLYGPILRLVAEATKGDEPGFSEILEKLRAIRADIFDVPPGSQEQLRRRTIEVAHRLQGRGWQTVLEVRSGDGDLSFIQTRTDGDRISGLAVMFIEPDGSAGFINIVGEVSPEELGRLGRTFDIEPLEQMGRELGDGAPTEPEDSKP